MGVPQFLRENVQSPLFVPSPYVISAYGSTRWNSMQQQQRVLQPNLPALAANPNVAEVTAEYAVEGTTLCHDVVDVPSPSSNRGRQMSLKTFKNQKVRSFAFRNLSTLPAHLSCTFYVVACTKWKFKAFRGPRLCNIRQIASRIP